MRIRRVIIVVGLLAAVAAGVIYARYRLYPGSDADDAVRISGNVEITTTEVSFKVPGRLIERLVAEGETVARGQPVARLDNRDLVIQVAQRRAEAELARAGLAELTAGSRPEQIAEARAALERGRSDAERAKLEFERVKSLYDRKLAVSQQEFETADASFKSAAATVTESEQRLALLIRGTRGEQIDQAAARWEQAKAALELAEMQLGDATLVAPISGLVLSQNVEPGEYVAPGTPVVTVGDLGHPWVRAYISETDLGRVIVGQAVKIRNDSFPDKAYAGKVSFISSEAEFTPKNVQTNKERVKLVYRIKIAVENTTLELKAGMPVDGEILRGP